MIQIRSIIRSLQKLCLDFSSIRSSQKLSRLCLKSLKKMFRMKKSQNQVQTPPNSDKVIKMTCGTFSATVHSTQISRQNQQTKSDKKTKTNYLILLTKFLINFPYFSSFELIMRFFERIYLMHIVWVSIIIDVISKIVVDNFNLSYFLHTEGIDFVFKSKIDCFRWLRMFRWLTHVRMTCKIHYPRINVSHKVKVEKILSIIIVWKSAG